MTPQEFFKKDLFAENAGVVLLEVREGYSKAKLEIKPEHLNAGARTQGGAIFTLADLALAAAANSHGTLAFSLSSSITFLRASGPGDTLYAEARERYIGRSIRIVGLRVCVNKFVTFGFGKLHDFGSQLTRQASALAQNHIRKYLLLCRQTI